MPAHDHPEPRAASDSSWVDGALVEEHQARISPFDHGLLTGDGVFETLRIYRGEPFCWRRHYERLARSASGMTLAIPPAERCGGRPST